MNLSLPLDDAAAERARHLALLIDTAEAARAEAVTRAAAASVEPAERDELTAAAARHLRERDLCARELGLLLAAPLLAAG